MIMRILVGLVCVYQDIISPLISPRCRFYPSCSQYAIDALRKHGPGKGLWVSARRLVKCHPFHPGGYDPA